MNSVANSFCLLVIMCSLLQANCESYNGFTALFGSDKLFLVNSEKPGAAVEMKNFTNETTAMAVYEDYLFVSIKRDLFSNDSTIFRCQTHDIEFGRSPQITCEDFDTVKSIGGSVLSMTVVDDDLFAGTSKGVMWRCSANETNSCRKFNTVYGSGFLGLLSAKITGLDYNSLDHMVYATANSGDLLRCAIDKSDSCQKIYKDKKELMAVKIAYNAIWVGKEQGKLLKCPLNSKKINCYQVDRSPTNNNIHFIGATKGKLYVSLKKNELWECDPNMTSKLCTKAFDSPADAKSLIIN